MFFSVVIPLYNKENFIESAIRSVINQSFSDFEIIVVDDGSTDSSLSIVKAIKDPRIRIYSIRNSGVSYARNFGVNEAQANWIAFLDGDDEWNPDYLQKSFEFLCEHNNVSFLGANYYINDFSKKAINLDIKDGIHNYFNLFKNQCSPNQTSTTIVNKICLNRIGGFPVGMKQLEDWYVWFKLALSVDFGYINKPMSFYRFTNNSASRSFRDPLDFYKDVTKFVDDLLLFKRGSNLLYKDKLFFYVLNEVILNVALDFASSNQSDLSFSLMKRIRIRYSLSLLKKKNILYLIYHLLIPVQIKVFIKNNFV